MSEFDKKQGNYFFLPKWICQSDLLPVCKILLGRIFVLTSYGKNECYCKDKMMAIELGLGERTVAKAVSILKQEKYISVRIVQDNFSKQRMVGLSEKCFKDPAQDAVTTCTNCSTDTAQNAEPILQDMQEPNKSTLQDVHDGSCITCSKDPAQDAVTTLHKLQDTNKNIQTRNINRNNNLENIYGENSKNETDLCKHSITKSSSHEFSKDGSENSERTDSEKGRTLEEICAVPEKPERGALSDTHKRQKKSSAELVKDNPPTYEETLELVKNVISTHIQERIKENKPYEYTQGLDASNEAHSCLDYYEANGFTRKQGSKQVPLTSWKLAVSGWVRRHLSQLLERYSRGEQLYARPKPQQTIQGLMQDSVNTAAEIRRLVQNDPLALNNDSMLLPQDME